MTTTVFDPTLHPRHLTGTFAPKIMSAPEVTVEADDDLESRRSFGDDNDNGDGDGFDGYWADSGRGIPSPENDLELFWGHARLVPFSATCLLPEASSR